MWYVLTFTHQSLSNPLVNKPIVHIAHSSQMTGRYDLRRLSALKSLARFILSLRQQTRTILSRMRTPYIRKFCWRMEHVGLARLTRKQEAIVKVTRWLMKLPVKGKRTRYDPVTILLSGTV